MQFLFFDIFSTDKKKKYEKKVQATPPMDRQIFFLQKFSKIKIFKNQNIPNHETYFIHYAVFRSTNFLPILDRYIFHHSSHNFGPIRLKISGNVQNNLRNEICFVFCDILIFENFDF